MEFDFIWWHWIVLGLGMIILELFTSTWIMLSFGLSSILVGVLTKIFSLPLSFGLGLWTIMSLALTYFFFTYFKKRGKISSRGQTSNNIGSVGIIDKNKKDMLIIRFEKPILGSRVWNIESKDTLIVGDKAIMIAVKGQTIVVTKEKQENK